MFTTKAADDYDKIILSLKEKLILYCILKRKQVPNDFCNDIQKNLFLRYDLVYVQQNQIVTSTGRVCPDPNATKYLVATDKAFRYFLYRKESYFKGKFPVVIAFIALVKSFDMEICRLFKFVAHWLSTL